MDDNSKVIPTIAQQLRAQVNAGRTVQINAIVTETAADLFYAWLLSQGWTEPPVDPEGCGMCDFRAAMVRALKEGQ